MKTYSGIGVMTGTSLDGIDLAYCDFQEENGQFSFQIQQTESIPMDPNWKARLKNLYAQSAEVYAKTDIYFAHYLGKNIQAFVEKYQLKPDFVASHGQTIFHRPEKSYTAQIGDGETLVTYLNCPLVTNFRNKNVAAGGEGAPLVPFGEQHLWPDFELFLNLGGIANMSWRERAFDVSPCNMALNQLVSAYIPDMEYDINGAIAASGEVHQALLQSLNQLSYYQRKPPKSLGAEWVQEVFFQELNTAELSSPDALRTVVEHIAHQIGLAAKRLHITDQQMLVTGGGSHNSFLMERIEAHLSPQGIELADVDRQIIDFKEAIIFAFLGLCSLLGKPNTLAKSTGSQGAVLGGSIHLPPGGFHALLD